MTRPRNMTILSSTVECRADCNFSERLHQSKHQLLGKQSKHNSIRRRQLVLEKQGKFAFSKPQLFDDVISTSSHIGMGFSIDPPS